MPHDGAIIFRDLASKLDVFNIECDKCDRRGRYHLRRLIERYGIDAKPNGQKIDTRGSGVPPIFECQIASYDRPPSRERLENLSLRSVQICAHDCVRIRSGLLAH